MASRRHAEELIAAGRVSVNGAPHAAPGLLVDSSDELRVDGAVVVSGAAALEPARKPLVVALNKPRGVVCSLSDERGRPDLAPIVASALAALSSAHAPPRARRLVHVGRLDRDTTGLLLLTDDGELAQRVAHPSHGLLKEYIVTIARPRAAALARALVAGVTLDDGAAAAVTARPLDDDRVALTLAEGRNRIVRRMVEAAGERALELERVAVGPVKLGGLGVGAARALGAREERALRAAVGLR